MDQLAVTKDAEADSTGEIDRDSELQRFKRNRDIAVPIQTCAVVYEYLIQEDTVVAVGEEDAEIGVLVGGQRAAWKPDEVHRRHVVTEGGGPLVSIVEQHDPAVSRPGEQEAQNHHYGRTRPLNKMR